MIKPAAATLRVWPTGRPVETIAAATPDCGRGILESRVLTGALTMPKRSPKTT
jgi:hypothetical protein